MKTRTLALSLAVLTLAPAAAAAQGFGIAGRAGTLGVGGEAALGLGDRLVVRGGAGFWPFEPDATFDDLDVTLTLPEMYNVGVDLYLNGALRVGGGVLFRADDPEVTGVFNSPQQIGNQEFTPDQLGTLLGVIDSRDQAPYVLIGFGNQVAPGFGLSLDLGVAFMGEPEVGLDARGGSFDADQEPLRSELDREAQQFEDDMRTYLEIWPILSLGLRYGF